MTLLFFNLPLVLLPSAFLSLEQIYHSGAPSRNRNHQPIDIGSYILISSSPFSSSRAKRKDNSPQSESYASNSITFAVPEFSGTVNVLDPGALLAGKNATIWLTPLTSTLAYLCVLSPLI
jgi:hypothetical protein